MKRGHLGILSLMGMGASVWIGLAAPTQAAEPVAPAKATYLRYCSACHGESGKGDGVVSQLMTPKPTDLTQLTKKAGGVFPFLQTMRSIDGRDSIRAHGDPDMPVWGDIVDSELPDSIDHQAAIRGRMMLITEYIESIQAK